MMRSRARVAPATEEQMALTNDDASQQQRRHRRPSLTRLALSVPSPSGEPPRATSMAAASVVTSSARSRRARRNSVGRFVGQDDDGASAAGLPDGEGDGVRSSPASAAPARGGILRRARRASLTAIAAVTSPSAREEPVSADAAGIDAAAAADAGADADAGAGAEPPRKEGVMQRMRRTSLTAIASVARTITSPGSVLRGQRAATELQPELALECRFAGCGCSHTARSEELLEQHYRQCEAEHTDLIRSALAQIEADNGALRDRVQRGAAALTTATSAVATAERASRSSNLALKKLQRELRAAALARTGSTELMGARLESRLQSLARDPPGQGECDAQVAKGRAAITTLDRAADPYKRQRCVACSCIYTEFANQVAACARHPGEEDVSGRWTCCQKPYTGLHFNGCVLSIHTSAPLSSDLPSASSPGPGRAHAEQPNATTPAAGPASPMRSGARTGRAGAPPDRDRIQPAGQWLQSNRAKEAIRSVLPPPT
jgi:hypothetical protein